MTTNLRSIYAASAKRADDHELLRLVTTLEAEPEGDPHIAQALEVFTGEAQRRGLLGRERLA
jgi:hypothetical protein